MKIAPEENYPQALIPTLIVNQTLTLTGGQFSLGAIFRTPKNINRKISLLRKFIKYKFSIR